jgi:hypothetical protein
MPRQNRVAPDGTLMAVPDRGLFWGNRGGLHDPEGRLVRYSRGRAWAICVLEFKGRRRQLWAPGRLTELFFLDEATSGVPGVGEIDARLHADRLVRPGIRRTYTASLSGLPDGAMVEADEAPWLVHDGGLLAWTPGGYRDRVWRQDVPAGPMTVITPRTTVAVLAAGYRPVIHPSAVTR